MASHKRNPAAPAGTSGRSPRRRRTASGHLIGYARVSTDDQNLALQLDALKQAGCRRVFRDVGSGSLSHRPELGHLPGRDSHPLDGCVYGLHRRVRAPAVATHVAYAVV